jgi:hypothetical protein
LALDEGGAVAIKTARTPDDVEALRYEIDLLRQASHPGLVAVIDSPDHDAEDPELRTRYAGEPLERWRGDVFGAVGLGAAIAATLADLHAMGVVHGRIDGSHVLLGADGRPRLCGFAPPGDRGPEDDVAALAQLLGQLVERANATDPRWPFQRRRGGIANRRAIADVLQRAAHPDSVRRPPARSLATALLAAVPGAELPQPAASAEPRRYVVRPPHEGDSTVRPDVLRPRVELHAVSSAASAGNGPTNRDDTDLRPADEPNEEDDPVFGNQTTAESEAVFTNRPWPSTPPARRPSPQRRAADVRERQGAGPPTRRRRTGVAALLGLTMAAAGALVLRSGRPLPVAQGTLAVGEPPPACDGPQDPPTTTAPGDVTSADVDGDGCADDVRVVSGIVEVGGQRWQVGAADDAVAVADWDCNGTATPAIYRPATGEVFVFPSWASAGQPLTVTAVDTIAGGSSLVPGEVAGGTCPPLTVEMPSGERHAIEVDR